MRHTCPLSNNLRSGTIAAYMQSRENTIFRKTRLALFLTQALLGSLAGAATLRQIAIIDLPGPPGKRFDYLTVDYQHNYLLSAHLGAGLLYVIDLKTNKLVKTIPDVPGVEGVEYAPDLNKPNKTSHLCRSSRLFAR
jgi:hypothetical protein